MQFSLKKTYFIENSNGLGTLQAKPMYTCTCKIQSQVVHGVIKYF